MSLQGTEVNQQGRPFDFENQEKGWPSHLSHSAPKWGATPFVSTATQIPNLLKVEVRSLRTCGAPRSRLGHCSCLQQTLSPTSSYSRPTGLEQLGLFVCMQDGEGLQHCLHKIQSLTISKTAVAQHQQNSVQSSHHREHTHPTFPSSHARNFSATEGCHRLVTMATQSTLNQTKKITHSLCITYFFLPPFG